MTIWRNIVHLRLLMNLCCKGWDRKGFVTWKFVHVACIELRWLSSIIVDSFDVGLFIGGSSFIFLFDDCCRWHHQQYENNDIKYNVDEAFHVLWYTCLFASKQCAMKQKRFFLTTVWNSKRVCTVFCTVFVAFFLVYGNVLTYKSWIATKPNVVGVVGSAVGREVVDKITG